MKKKKKKIKLKTDNSFFRKQKPKIEPATKRNYEITRYYIAIKMVKCFRYLPWMSHKNVLGPNMERIDTKGKTYFAKFTRKK